jgi:hypothetical protein
LQAALHAASTTDQALKQIASQKAEFEAAVASIKDPAKLRALMKQHEVDEAKFAEDLLIEHLENQEKTPEQREMEELRKFKSSKEKEAEDSKKAAEQARVAEQTKQIVDAYEAQFTTAIAEAGLPRTFQTAQQLLEIVQDGLAAGYDVSPKEAAVLLRGRVTESNKALFKGMSIEQAKQALPSELIDLIIKDYTAGLRAQVAKAPDAPQRKVKVEKKGEESESDWWDKATRW